MPQLGAHMSIAGGPARAIESGGSAGCVVVQLFTRNNNRWRSTPFTRAQLDAWEQAPREQVRPVAAHGSYLINLASPEQALWERSIAALSCEMVRSKQLCIPQYVLHPGAHMGEGAAAGIERVARALDRVLAETTDTMVLLETTAGQGSSIGHSFVELAAIREAVKRPERVGYCLDTAHVFAAGYGLATEEAYGETWRLFEETLGLAHLGLIHLNDSKRELGSRVDRHEHVGRGHIGLAAFWRLMNDERLASVPMVLETPKDKTLVQDKWSLAVLRALVGASESEMQEIADEVVENGPG